MNKRDRDVLLALAGSRFSNQRELAAFCECSLGAVNASVKNLLEENYINSEMAVTQKAIELFNQNAPRRAILLASGFGVQASPVIANTPYALLEIQGEPLIERIIKQLNAVGVKEIYVVVGYAKERFEYLIDKYNVELIVNTEYARRQTLHSLALAKSHLENCYIVHCNTWFKNNPFRNTELYSWYMVSETESLKSFVRVNRKQELVVVPTGTMGNDMAGIAYLLPFESEILERRLSLMDADRRYNFCLWEDALYESNKMFLEARLVHKEDIREIVSFEDMLEIDSKMSIPISDIASILEVDETDINNVLVLKKGAVNSSYTFTCNDQKYIVRIPSYGISKLAIQMHESAAYSVLSGHSVADETVYLNDDTGLKISKYIENVRHCDPFDQNDVKMCMYKLREFHNLKLKVNHRFDLFDNINYFESLWNGDGSVYKDYAETKEKIFSLRSFIEARKGEECLTHMDPVPENFLIADSGCNADVRLIDWEYSAMQDPHVDIAMFCLYSLYNRNQVDSLIDIYFDGNVSEETRIKIYCYMAVGGLLWSNWCESKYKQGIEFGVYSLKQYGYAKEYYRIVKDKIKEF